MFKYPTTFNSVVRIAHEIAKKLGWNIFVDRNYQRVWLRSRKDARAKIRITFISSTCEVEVTALAPSEFVVPKSFSGGLTKVFSDSSHIPEWVVSDLIPAYANLWKSQPLSIM